MKVLDLFSALMTIAGFILGVSGFTLHDRIEANKTTAYHYHIAGQEVVDAARQCNIMMVAEPTFDANIRDGIVNDYPYGPTSVVALEAAIVDLNVSEDAKERKASGAVMPSTRVLGLLHIPITIFYAPSMPTLLDQMNSAASEITSTNDAINQMEAAYQSADLQISNVRMSLLFKQSDTMRIVDRACMDLSENVLPPPVLTLYSKMETASAEAYAASTWWTNIQKLLYLFSVLFIITLLVRLGVQHIP